MTSSPLPPLAIPRVTWLVRIENCPGAGIIAWVPFAKKDYAEGFLSEVRKSKHFGEVSLLKADVQILPQEKDLP